MTQGVVLSIQKMKCGGCVASVTKALQSVAGVDSARVDLDSASAVVEGDADVPSLIDAVRAAGFDAAEK